MAARASSWALLLLLSGSSFLSVETQNVACPKEFVMSKGVLESPSDLPETGADWKCVVSVAPPASGLGVNLTLQQLRLDAALGDFLTLNAGPAADAPSTAVFSWTLSKPLQMSMPERDSFFVRLHVAPRTPEQSTAGLGFKLTYDTFELPTVAPTTSTTPTPLPTPPDAVPRPSIHVHVGGLQPQAFVNQIDAFKIIVANASNTLCDRVNISLLRPIAPSHVQVWDVRACPSNWPGAATCVSVAMSVPAFAANGSYELSALHLQQMWVLLETSGQLPPPAFVYRPPTPAALAWWAAVFFGVLLLFLLLLLLAWRVEVHQTTASAFRTKSGTRDSLWPRADVTVSSAQVQVPPYLVMKEPPDDAPSRRFYYEERNSYAVGHQEGVVNEAFEDTEPLEDTEPFEDEYGDLDIVSSRNYIYDNPDAEEDVELPAVSLPVLPHQSETTL